MTLHELAIIDSTVRVDLLPEAVEFALSPFSFILALHRTVRPFCVEHLASAVPFIVLELALIKAPVKILLLAFAIVLVVSPATIVVALDLLEKCLAESHHALSASLASCEATCVSFTVCEDQLSYSVHDAILPEAIVDNILGDIEASLVGLAALQLTLVEALVSIDEYALSLWLALLANFAGVSVAALENFV